MKRRERKMAIKMKEIKREKETERETETDIQTDRQTDRERQTDRDRQRESGRSGLSFEGESLNHRKKKIQQDHIGPNKVTEERKENRHLNTLDRLK